MELVTEKMNCLNQVNHLGSASFGFISSTGLVSELEKHDLKLDKVVEMKIRKNKETRQGFQTHRLVFDTGTETKDGKLQLIVTNSHEGGSSLKFQLGFFRFVCSNGLIVGKTISEPIKLRHTFKQIERLTEVIAAVLEQKNKVIKSIEAMKSKQLTQDQIDALAIKALELRGYSDKYANLLPIFEVKRGEDLERDAFTIFNVMQENLLRTGFKAVTEDNKVIKLRAIKSINEQAKINADLWDMFAAA